MLLLDNTIQIYLSFTCVYFFIFIVCPVELLTCACGSQRTTRHGLFSHHHVGSEAGTLVFSFGGKLFYSLSYLVGSGFVNIVDKI